MINFERLVPKISFYHCGDSVYNREKLLELVEKDTENNIILEIGESINYRNEKHIIKNIVFSMSDYKFPKAHSKMDVYTKDETGFTNCEIEVWIEKR